MTLDRSDWILLLASKRALRVEGPEALDPVRIQKGMFLLSMRGPSRDLYSFRPYNWGPFSPMIYGDLDALVANGLMERIPVPGQSWDRYRPTAAGEERAREIADTLDPKNREWLGRTRLFLTTRSFSKLLEDIYDAYPRYATRSQFRR